MKKLSKWLKWIDDNILKILLGVFILIIPLYPKLPLKMVNYTYIAIRLEDLYIGLLVFVFFIQLLRKKVVLNENFLLLFLLFWLSVFASYFFGVYISKTVIIKTVGILHSLRRIEYMIIFFITGSIIKNKKDFITFLLLTFASFFLVVVYGIGQKFFGWPAVQTMNPEYAKGYLLFLTADARISSTFAGHYDLAAYLVFFFPIIIGFFLYKRNVIYFMLFVLGLFVLVLTASRASYIAYFVSMILFLICFKKWKTLLAILCITFLFTFFSKSLTSRLSRTFQVKQIFVNQQTGQVVVPQRISTKEVPAGSMSLLQINNDKTSTVVTSDTQQLMISEIREQVRNEASKSGKILNANEEDILVASLAASLKPISSLVPDISFATRLQVEWPRAIKAFITHPLLGTGPSSITEATDNDYLRSLGEFGLIGTMFLSMIFFGIIKKVSVFAFKIKSDKKILFFSFLFGLLALLINATYIDVFEASKVAYIFWLVAALFTTAITYEKS